jgi:opacity protein-like surface antigen
MSAFDPDRFLARPVRAGRRGGQYAYPLGPPPSGPSREGLVKSSLMPSPCVLLVLFPLSVIGLIQNAQATDAQIDTERLFSFNLGSDIGEVGQKEIQASLTGALGRDSGLYAALANELSFQYTPLDNLQVSLSIEGTAHQVENVIGIEDRRAVAFGGLSASLGYRLLDRATRGIGVTLYAEPHWTLVDEDTGSPTQGFDAAFTIAIDKEFIPGKVIGVFNLLYQPETARSSDGTWLSGATAELSAGVTFKLTDNLFGGLEMQYLRKYDALDFQAYSGQAFFVGPSISLNLTKQSWLTAGWNVQVVGRASGTDGRLDLANFSHNLIRAGWGLEF